MKLKNAVKILRHFRDWHSGKDCRNWDDTGLIRKEVGHAMDVILKHHGMPDPLTDCEACRYFAGCSAGALRCTLSIRDATLKEKTKKTSEIWTKK